MRSNVKIVAIALSLLAIVVAHAADTDPEGNSLCIGQQQKDPSESPSAATCGKRSTSKSEAPAADGPEPVEMTVGSPPMISDDTGTPGPNGWEINFLLSADLAGGQRQIDLPVLDVNYGVGDALQLTYSVPYVFSSQRETNASGTVTDLDTRWIGDSTLGIKYRFYDDRGSGLSLAVYPQIEHGTPGSTDSISDSRTILLLPFLVTKEFKQVSMTGNIGAEVSSGRTNYFGSFGVGARWSDKTALFAEVAGTNLNVPDEKHVLLNVGVRRKISDTQSVSGALGRDVYAGRNESENTYVTFAYQILFGQH
ncbi:MAG TPA: hypothetical protein VK660_00350 [Xanthomonadaceae bacterium]|jgi:hypothetical protein|nr:hypothetical protein [Xanthomonadaceae bacterium]